jgi:hypothetical protein
MTGNLGVFDLGKGRRAQLFRGGRKKVFGLRRRAPPGQQLCRHAGLWAQRQVSVMNVA